MVAPSAVVNISYVEPVPKGLFIMILYKGFVFTGMTLKGVRWHSAPLPFLTISHKR